MLQKYLVGLETIFQRTILQVDGLRRPNRQDGGETKANRTLQRTHLKRLIGRETGHRMAVIVCKPTVIIPVSRRADQGLLRVQREQGVAPDRRLSDRRRRRQKVSRGSHLHPGSGHPCLQVAIPQDARKLLALSQSSPFLLQLNNWNPTKKIKKEPAL
jgi:hypothetical protein